MMRSILLRVILTTLAVQCRAEPNLLKTISDITTGPVSDAAMQYTDFISTAAKSGYVAEKYEATTEDGYVLTLYRIPPSKECKGKEKKTPVLLMHGLIQSSACFLDAGVDNGLGFLIPNECHDTWFGNQRGTYESRRHVRLNPDTDTEFWRFSYHEMGVYDLPAIIDRILEVTGAPKLNYVGYSQGQEVLYIALSEKPEYNDKIGFSIGLSPCTRHKNTKSAAFRGSTEAANTWRSELELIGVWEILSKGFPIQGVLGSLCQIKLLAGIVCGLATALIDYPGAISAETEQRLFQHAPGGTSIQTFAHHGQSMSDEEFRKFDYGPKKNQEIYGCSTAPVYDLDAVKIPVVVMAGTHDAIVDELDHDWAASKINSLVEYVKLPGWNHLVMVYGESIGTTLFPKIKEYLCQYD